MVQYLILLMVGMAVLLFGSVTDVRRRTVSSYLFIPLYVAGIVFLALYIHPPYWFYIAGILMFIATFMKTDLLVYPLVGVVFLIFSIFMVFRVFIFGFDLLVMSAIFLMGFQERFFGIGDINYALEMARDSRISLPLGGLTSQMYTSASSIGYGNLDMSSVIKPEEENPEYHKD